MDADDARAARLHGLVERLGVDHAHERSFKLSGGRVLDRRFLVGVHKRQLGVRLGPWLEAIAEELAPPAPLLERLLVDLGAADVIHLGFEGDATGCVYKLYLEFLAHVATPDRPLFRALKWSPDRPGAGALASYTAHRRLALDQLLERIGAAAPVAADAIETLLRPAVRRVGTDALLLLDVAEDDGPRRSFDLNLYAARLTLEEVAGAVEALAAAHGVSPALLARTTDPLGAALLGHVSAGANRDGEAFATVYHGAPA